MRIFLYLILFNFIIIENSYAISENEIKERLSNKVLEPIEGIWFREFPKGGELSGLKVGLVKYKNSVEMICLENGVFIKQGKFGNLSKISNTEYSGLMFLTFEGNTENANIEMTLLNTNQINEYNSSRFGEANLSWKRIWPENFNDYNQIIIKGVINEPIYFDLDNVKTECEELGFKKGTEKFGECVLKLTE